MRIRGGGTTADDALASAERCARLTREKVTAYCTQYRAVLATVEVALTAASEAYIDWAARGTYPHGEWALTKRRVCVPAEVHAQALDAACGQIRDDVCADDALMTLQVASELRTAALGAARWLSTTALLLRDAAFDAAESILGMCAAGCASDGVDRAGGTAAALATRLFAVAEVAETMVGEAVDVLAATLKGLVSLSATADALAAVTAATMRLTAVCIAAGVATEAMLSLAAPADLQEEMPPSDGAAGPPPPGRAASTTPPLLSRPVSAYPLTPHALRQVRPDAWSVSAVWTVLLRQPWRDDLGVVLPAAAPFGAAAIAALEASPLWCSGSARGVRGTIRTVILTFDAVVVASLLQFYRVLTGHLFFDEIESLRRREQRLHCPIVRSALRAATRLEVVPLEAWRGWTHVDTPAASVRHGPLTAAAREATLALLFRSGASTEGCVEEVALLYAVSATIPDPADEATAERLSLFLLEQGADPTLRLDRGRGEWLPCAAVCAGRAGLVAASARLGLSCWRRASAFRARRMEGRAR